MQRYLKLKNAYMNTLVDDDFSQKRFQYVKNVHNNYGLPELKINKALHYKNDKEYITTKYPNIDINASAFKKRPGAYGLTASFIEFLEKHKDTRDNFVIWYEDDALPGINKELFNKQLDIAMKSIIKSHNFNNVYFLGYTNYCKNDCGNINKWVKKTSNSKSGAHCIIFTKASINTILTYMKTHTIKLAVDELLYTLHENKVITAYDWGNNVLDESQMFCGLFKQKDTHCTQRESVISKSETEPYVIF